jgi:DMSO/TMAO reductase YedYZ molybdopterin-dependent catalytic subunit
MLKSFLDRREQEKLITQAGRLPPGQSLTNKFPVLHYGPVPIYPNLDSWTLRFFGLVEEEKSFSWADFTALPTRSNTLDIHCVTRWSKFDTLWEGVFLSDLIAAGILKLKPEAKYCIQHCEYGFTVNLPIEAMLEDNFMLAYRYEGQALEPEHGYPLRGLMGAIPGQHSPADRYLWKGGKWLRGLEFTAEDRAGFWEQNGYSMSANVWSEERFRRDY